LVSTWPAIAAARAGDRAARVPFRLAGRAVGSVAREHLPALAELVGGAGVVGPAHVDLPADAALLAALNAELRARGLIVAWRDEPYPVFEPGSMREWLRIERASARFWGTLTLGAHANGWIAGADGRPAALWIAQRSLTKATDPGRHDNLVGGGVPAGQSPWQTLQREGWEEAGLSAELLRQARPGRVVHVERAVPEGWQLEWLHVYDLQLPPDLVPVNQDGEVLRFERLPLTEAIALARGGTMTVDAALATLDFALRHRLLGSAHDALAAEAAALWRGGAAVQDD
jgi:8-oxo-dGTP pyrophosphatase MutT (NUDIX family)